MRDICLLHKHTKHKNNVHLEGKPLYAIEQIHYT